MRIYIIHISSTEINNKYYDGANKVWNKFNKLWPKCGPRHY